MNTGKKSTGKPGNHTKDNSIELVIHELRTPLTVIIGSIYTAMGEGVSPEDRRCLLQNAVQAAESLEKILENLQEQELSAKKSRLSEEKG